MARVGPEVMCKAHKVLQKRDTDIDMHKDHYIRAQTVGFLDLWTSLLWGREYSAYR
jgi:hypothetical protein